MKTTFGTVVPSNLVAGRFVHAPDQRFSPYPLVGILQKQQEFGSLEVNFISCQGSGHLFQIVWVYFNPLLLSDRVRMFGSLLSGFRFYVLHFILLWKDLPRCKTALTKIPQRSLNVLSSAGFPSMTRQDFPSRDTSVDS